MRWFAAGATVAVVGGAAAVYIFGVTERPSTPTSHGSAQPSAPARYADASSCAECHGEIARTYALTGMGRSFARAGAAGAALAQPATLHHGASGRSYAVFERGGVIVQRRHQTGFDGRETNVVEAAADYVIGSGRHAQTFVRRRPDGRLAQLPLTWYAERGGFWAMSPGYDKPGHQDFRRLIAADCMGCHNAYPPTVVADDRGAPSFPEPLPQGIDCQRCHGPGQAHVDAMKAGRAEAAAQTIVNPASLDRERQLETCMQCHLEPTSSPLPFQIRREEHPAFAFTPGKPLGEYFLFFDHAPGSGHDDKFDIAGGAYRLRKSPCFQKSEMTCGTCHDPHDIPRGDAATRHYTSVCASCHQGVHQGGPPRVEGPGPRATCVDCHMPKRRTDDAVHVVMTDHFIQRRRPARDLLAPKTEADSLQHSVYKGEVVPYYPAPLPSTPENELYVAVAQVQHGANLAAGIPRLESAIGRHAPARPGFYYELARAYAKAPNHEAVLRWADEALKRDPAFVPALKEIGAAALALGRAERAAGALERAVAIRPDDSDALADLGNVYLQQGKAADAERVLARALAVDPEHPRGHNTMGLTALQRGDTAAAEASFRTVVRHQPDLAEAQNNLGNVLARRRAYREAAYHFEQAIGSDPAYAAAHHSLGLVLGLTGPPARAVPHLERAARLAPGSADVHVDLVEMLRAAGRPDRATRHLDELARSPDPLVREAVAEARRVLDRGVR